MPLPPCPKCHAVHSRRVRQQGFFQQAILRRLGYYPWECRFCKAIFAVRNRGQSRDKGERASGESAAAG